MLHISWLKLIIVNSATFSVTFSCNPLRYHFTMTEKKPVCGCQCQSDVNLSLDGQWPARCQCQFCGDHTGCMVRMDPIARAFWFAKNNKEATSVEEIEAAPLLCADCIDHACEDYRLQQTAVKRMQNKRKRKNGEGLTGNPKNTWLLLKGERETCHPNHGL